MSIECYYFSAASGWPEPESTVVLVGGIRGHPFPQVCVFISWCTWQLWDFGWRMSKRFLGMMKMRTMGDKKVWVSATLELAASLVLMLCGRNRRKRMNKGLCETLTSKQCSFRVYMVKCHTEQREKHSPTPSTLSRHRVLSSAPKGVGRGQEHEWSMWGWGLHLSDFLLYPQVCQAQCLTSSMHSMYISEWIEELEWSYSPVDSGKQGWSGWVGMRAEALPEWVVAYICKMAVLMLVWSHL